MQKKLDIQAYEAAIQSCKHAQVHICFGLQVSYLILNDFIKPEHFAFDPKCYWQAIDWNKNTEVLKAQAQNLPYSCFSFAVIVLCETYFNLYNGETSKEDPDLCSAQMILRIVRNSVGHVSADSSEEAQMRWNVREKFYRKKYEVKVLDIQLDATDLDGQPFELKPLGGFENFLKLMKYLQKKLEEELLSING